MTPEEAITELNALTGDDAERDHAEAEGIVLALLADLHPDVFEAFSRLRDRADDWWFA